MRPLFGRSSIPSSSFSHVCIVAVVCRECRSGRVGVVKWANNGWMGGPSCAARVGEIEWNLGSQRRRIEDAKCLFLSLPLFGLFVQFSSVPTAGNDAEFLF